MRGCGRSMRGCRSRRPSEETGWLSLLVMAEPRVRFTKLIPGAVRAHLPHRRDQHRSPRAGTRCRQPALAADVRSLTSPCCWPDPSGGSEGGCFLASTPWLSDPWLSDPLTPAEHRFCPHMSSSDCLLRTPG